MITKKYAFLGILITIILIIVTVMLFLDNQELFMTIIRQYGYVGLFLVSFIGSSTIFFVIPTDIAVFTTGAFLNPFVVGIVGGFGKALGETIGYALGLGSRKIIEKKYKKEIKKWEKSFRKHGGFFIILFFAMTPLPDDIVGIIGGSLKYPFEKFFIANLIGKIILTLALSYAGFYGMGWFLNIFTPLA
jgi:membrane protein YqaA with SNARE-associated domain